MADIPIFPEPSAEIPVSNFVHLHVHSDYSLLDGVAKIDHLIARAKELKMPALALTDHGNMFGVLNFEHICHQNKINPIIGEEFYVCEKDHLTGERTRYGGKYYHLILLCKNQTGYKNMSWLSSKAFTEGLHYGKPCIDFEMLKEYHEGLICLSACIQGEIPQLLLHDDDEEAERIALKYAELFGTDHYYLELQDHGMKEQKYIAKKMIKMAKKLNLPLVVTNDIHYMKEEDWEAQYALTCINFKRLLDEKDERHHEMRGDNGEHSWYFKTEQEMAQLFPEVPEAMTNSVKIANMCNLEIHQYKTQELKDCLPRFELPEGFRKHSDYSKNQDEYVRFLVEEGLKKRYKEITPEIRERCNYELSIIFEMGFSGYFLIVWEFINWAKRHDKPIGPGRGSGAGSLIAYAMEITDIDPFRYKLIFERFLNPERVSMPDFDIDMDYNYRQDIIQHTRELYGDPQVGHIVTFGTLKAKQVIADVGRVLNIPLAEVNILKKCIPDNPKAKLKNAFEPANEKFPDGGQLIPYKDDPRYKRLFALAKKLENVNRNTGLHASGMVISLTPLPNWAPIFKDYKTGEVAVQYTMDIIEPCGLVKMDYLGLKTLSLIRYAENIINKHKKPHEPEFRTETVSEEDEKTFDLFCRGDTVAIFQFESPGMQKNLRLAKPRKLEELVALNALYRPGPMDYIPQYIEGKWKPETIRYPDECLEDILKETYGVMVYQEQVMQVSQRIAGFSLGEADMLRRAMGKKKPEVLMSKKKEFIEGALQQGFSEKHADEIFDIMVPFAGYGFNKSHAAAYSVVAYRTGWLKANKPAEFMAANLTNEITSTDTLPEYIAEARRMGIPVDPPDINRSDDIFDVVDGRIVFGLRGIKGMGTEAAKTIIAEREENGPYKDFMDFLKRAAIKTIKIKDEDGKETAKRPINNKAIEVLIKTGAFDNTGKPQTSEEPDLSRNRATLLENLEAAIKYCENVFADDSSGQQDLFGNTDEKIYADFVFKEVEDFPNMEKLNMEKDCIGCYVSGHPLQDWEKVIKNSVTLTAKNIDRAAKEAELEKNVADGQKTWQNRNSGKVYTILGIINEIKIIHTKNGGKEMAFAKLMDYHGTLDITFFPKTWETMKSRLEEGKVYAFKGKVDGSRDVPSVIAESLEDPNVLKEKSIKELHIALEEKFTTEQEIAKIKDFLFGKTGSCNVYFHIDVDRKSYILKANQTITITPDEETLQELKDFPLVKESWAE